MDWIGLEKGWTPMTIRDAVVIDLENRQKQTGISMKTLIGFLGVAASTFATWKNRRNLPNRHNHHIPKSHWILPWEKEAIIAYARIHFFEGYRPLCFQMMDQNIVSASPATVYRILKQAGLIRTWQRRLSRKGKGFHQPTGPHHHWHIDITYVNVQGTFMFLIAIIDGYSRFIVAYELRAAMEEKDVEIVVQRAKETFPESRAAVIHDRGSQFMAKEFNAFIRIMGLTQRATSVAYPQSNGKIERFFKTMKTEFVRSNSLLTINDARSQIAMFIHYYNTHRLHSAIGYVTPEQKLKGGADKIIQERKEKLAKARAVRLEYFTKTSILNSAV